LIDFAIRVIMSSDTKLIYICAPMENGVYSPGAGRVGGRKASAGTSNTSLEHSFDVKTKTLPGEAQKQLGLWHLLQLLGLNRNRK
jgi:hypothetical protein